MKCLAGKEPEVVSEVDPQFDGTGVTLMHILGSATSLMWMGWNRLDILLLF